MAESSITTELTTESPVNCARYRKPKGRVEGEVTCGAVVREGIVAGP